MAVLPAQHARHLGACRSQPSPPAASSGPNLSCGCAVPRRRAAQIPQEQHAPQGEGRVAAGPGHARVHHRLLPGAPGWTPSHRHAKLRTRPPASACWLHSPRGAAQEGLSRPGRALPTVTACMPGCSTESRTPATWPAHGPVPACLPAPLTAAVCGPQVDGQGLSDLLACQVGHGAGARLGGGRAVRGRHAGSALSAQLPPRVCSELFCRARPL